jgi:DNA-binding NarL/FixJ family response regulator
MSKQRPSATCRAPTVSASASALIEAPVSYWRRRVYNNTFTRLGELRTVRGWSVKIQHQGVRRTVSLRSVHRDEAAAEAQAIYRCIVTKGWEAARRFGRRRRRWTGAPRHLRADKSRAKTDLTYWKLRLLRRRYPAPPQGGVPAPFSARIEHGDQGYYFPLASNDQDAAAAKALEIYRTVLERGWKEACNRFTREVTIGICWASNPLAWTYTTLHSEILEPAEARVTATLSPLPTPASGESNATPVGPILALVEGEPALQRALSRLLVGRGSRVLRFDTGEQTLREALRQPMHLVLLSQYLPDMSGAECAERLALLKTSLPALVYSVHEDSEQMFRSTPGGACGYLLKRTPPEHLLQPIEGLLKHKSFFAEQIIECVRQYFQTTVLSLQAGGQDKVRQLTRREMEIMDCLSKGYLDKEVAVALGISVWTVHGHLKNIYDKFGVHSRTEAVVKYLHK